MDTSNSVTTYVRQRPLFERDDENERIELGSKSSSLYKPLQFIGIKPHASRTKAVLHLTGEWEGRDALLVSKNGSRDILIWSSFLPFSFGLPLAICSIYLPPLLFFGADREKRDSHCFRSICKRKKDYDLIKMAT